MTTYTKLHINPLKPTINQINLKDIAHALSLICRGNGQVKHFYSVGQHCINCCEEAKARGESERIQLACLLHDGAEAYLSDVIRPVKVELIGYTEIEDNFLKLILEKFGLADLTPEEWNKVKQIDDALLQYDLVELLGEELSSEGYTFVRTPDIEFVPFEQIETVYEVMVSTLMTK